MRVIQDAEAQEQLVPVIGLMLEETLQLNPIELHMHARAHAHTEGGHGSCERSTAVFAEAAHLAVQSEKFHNFTP